MKTRTILGTIFVAYLATACAEEGQGDVEASPQVLQQASGRYQSFLLQTGTALHDTGANFEFAMAGNRDLFAIKKNATGSGSTEVHVLSAASGYKTFTLQTPTALHETGSDFEFALASNRDLIAIKKSATGSGSTEVHILSAASNYRQFILQTGTALHETGDNFEFELAANRDLYAIKKSNTGAGTTEVHILSAASNYQRFSYQGATALHETDGTFKFLLASNNDLLAIKKRSTGSGSTEIHVLAAGSGTDRYKRFSLQTGTVLHETGDNFDFALAPNRDLVAIKKSETGSGSTELHIL